MQTIEYRFVDKSTWGDGPWQSEPDKVQFPDPVTGLPCLAVRNPLLGHWCGYVGVIEGHPYFQVEDEHADASIHGGLTFAGLCRHDETEHGICHVPAEGESDKVWWLGFDCAHFGDMSPGLESDLNKMCADTGRTRLPTMGEYRTLEYVKNECEDLARQLAEMVTP